jgi:beta-1,4-mannosyltransferase
MGNSSSEQQGPKMRVLFDTREMHWGQNPYVLLLAESTRPEVEVVGFTWRTLLVGKFEAVHLHWPEYLLQQPSRSRTLAARIFMLCALGRMKLNKVPIVRTMHNKGAHVSTSRVDDWILRRLDSMVSARIWLTARRDEDALRSQEDEVILHGDYSPWLKALNVEVSAAPGKDRMLCFGIMRRYKRFEEPARAILAAGRGHLTIAGSPADSDYAGELQELAASSPEFLTFVGRRLADSELIRLIKESDVVIVPYDDLYNSGVILLALSLQRPVAVRDSSTAQDLVAEYGDYWIRVFGSEFGPESLQLVLDGQAARSGPAHSDDRRWSKVGRQHRDLYFSMVAGKSLARGVPLEESTRPL